MLILTRKKTESIEIGNNVVIKILQIDRNSVKLGIEAPKDVRVLRAELTKFESAAETAAGHESQPNDVEVGSQTAPASVTEYESQFEFSTEYAAEIEDQMLCVIPC